MGQKINIRPTTGVYATYKNLRYEPWTALAEFVDNSTQSFFDHKSALLTLPTFKKLIINIEYEQNDSGDIVRITDNAFGMESSDFERAIQLDKPPLVKSGRNEFGMGLKTAACWFGTLWTVKSTQLGSEIGYKATMDINQLAISKEDLIDLDIYETKKDEHYTIIEIRNLNKKITGSRTIGKVKDFLSSIYREDLRRGDVEIVFKGQTLNFENPEVYCETLSNGNTIEWKKDVSFSVNRNGQYYDVTGFIALRARGSRRDAGFTLIRRGRVIVGGPESNYRPEELFGDSGTYTYQRLFGELHMDNWPVTQAKDNFDWHTDGLEEEFIAKMLPFTKDYRVKAEDIRFRAIKKVPDTLKEAGDILEKGGLISNVKIEIPQQEEVKTNDSTSKSEEPKIDDTYTKQETDQDTSVIIEGPRSGTFSFTYKGSDYSFLVQYDITNPSNPWLIVTQKDAKNYSLILNMKHKFFFPFLENGDFMNLITEFVISMVLSEIEASSYYPDGRIDIGDVRTIMNTLLEKMAEAKK